MSLRLLISNQGLELYPNHNTPSTSGGFNYGNSYTPVFEGEFRQKILILVKEQLMIDQV